MRAIGRSITFKWMIFSILLATIPLTIAGIKMVEIYQRDVKKSVIDFQKEKANLVVEKTRGFMEKVTDLLLVISRDEHVTQTHPTHTSAHLRILFSLDNDYFSEMSLLDRKGQEVLKISHQDQTDLKNRSGSEMFTMASKGKVFYGDFYFSLNGMPTIGVAVPIWTNHDRMGGVLAARVELRHLSGLIKQTQIGEKGVAYVLDREGTIIAHREDVPVLLGPFVDRVIAGEDGCIEFESVQGQKYLVTYKSIPELKWGVVVYMPVEEAYRPIKEITRTSIRWIVIASLLAFILSFILTKRSTSPIKQLSNEMAKVSGGDLNVHIEPSSKDEVGQLTRSFNRMIEDLKQSQEVIKEAEEKYRMIFENSKDMVFITSLNGKFIEINPAGVEMLGYRNREEMREVRVRDTYIHPEERKRFQEEVAQNGFVKDFEVKLKKKDGIPLDCLITATARRDREGCIIGYEGTTKNISYRKKMEEELYQRTKELETLYDLSVLINQNLDIDKVLPMALDRALKLTGFEMGTIYLVSDDGEWLELKYHQNYPFHLAEAVKRLKRGEGVAGSAIDKKEIITLSIDHYPSPRIIPALIEESVKTLVGIPLISTGEAVGAICLTSRSERLLGQNEIHLFESLGNQIGMTVENTRLLEEIKGSEEKYRAVVEGAHDGICVIGLDNRFRYVNKRMAEISGYPEGELIGRDFRDSLTGESRQMMVDRFTRWKKGETLSPSFELDLFKVGGEIRHVEISARLMKVDQRSANYICFVKDLTDHKKLEEQLIQTEKLRALGEMASGVAHDFNNALAAILGNTQLLLYSAQDEETREILKTIEKVARDSAQTVKRLQEFTRKRPRQELFKLDMNSIIQDVVEITRPKWKDEAQGKGIQIEIVSHLGDVPDTAGNASEMREVITNIIFNAIEAMPMGGKIEIRSFREKENIHVRIADTGIGMDETTKKKIFEPFFTTKPFSNTGLGLSMSYGIIKRFGGEIEVESRVGGGTTFTLILPVTLEGAEEKIPDSEIKKAKAARILVIDDEKTVRDVLAKMLSHANHKVTVATNGEEGVRLFNEQKFDMVLTDLGMPGMSGWEVCRSIKQINSSTPVGMITGWGLEVDQDRKEEAGLDFIITKPFDFNRVVKEVSEKIESRTTVLSL
jgi:PAS domain S-box-containing protein